MRFHHVRAFGLLVGLVAVLAVASIAAAAPLSEMQISRQIANQLSRDNALENVTVSVQESVVRLSGTVPSFWARTKAIAEARELEDVTTVVSDALDIERAESDPAIAEQVAKHIWRVSIPGLVPLPAEELPVSLERIKRRLHRLPPTHEERSLLRLSYYIEVYGRLPRIDLVQGFDVHNGPVPYGAPTHAELLAVMSPREFRPAVAKLNSIIGWTFKSLNAPR